MGLLHRYWARAPTGNEWLVESVLSINHGATGASFMIRLRHALTPLQA